MRFYFGVILTLLIPATVYGQSTTHDQGDKSLNFSFNGLNIEDYKYGIGGKYWKSNEYVYVGSLNIDKNEMKYDSAGAFTSESDNMGFGVSFGIERHFGKSEKVSPYIGSEFGYKWNKTETTTGTLNNNAIARGYVLNALLGVEYLVIRQISLAAEYSFGYQYFKTSNSTATGPMVIRSNGFNVNSAKLMLLVYF